MLRRRQVLGTTIDDRRLWFLAGPRLTPAAWGRPPHVWMYMDPARLQQIS